MNTTGTLTRTVYMVATDAARKVTEIKAVPAGTTVYLGRFVGRETLTVRLPHTLLCQDVSMSSVTPEC